MTSREDELVYNEAHHEVASGGARFYGFGENKDELLPLTKERESVALIGLLAQDKDSPLGAGAHKLLNIQLFLFWKVSKLN